MRRLYLLIIVFTIFLSNCNNREPKVIETQNNTFATKTVTYNKSVKTSTVKLEADYPIAGNRNLTTAIRKYICEEFGGTYNSNLNRGDLLLNHYGNKIYKEFENEYISIEDNIVIPFEYSHTIKKTEETGNYITYQSDNYEYMGGAHGISSSTGCTFRKSDGLRFSYNMLYKTNKPGFRQLIKKGLISYFRANGDTITTDDDLMAILITESDINHLPLPEQAPYLTKGGVVFIYQQYEIAPYSTGMPSFTISYSDILPFLTTEGKTYINHK